MLINYPVHDLDLSNYVCVDKDKAKYDLYAVSCHFGGVGGGHYTAYAKNFATNKWYNFDDSSVSEVNEANVVTAAGYVLFYRRKDSWESISDQYDVVSASSDPSQSHPADPIPSSAVSDDDDDDDDDDDGDMDVSGSPVKGYDNEIPSSPSRMADSLLEDGNGLD
jgi:hypothetical protein